MIRRYLNSIYTGLQNRDCHSTPGWLYYTSLVLVGTGFYIALCITMVDPSNPPEYHFVEERGAATVLSAIFFAAAAAFSLSCLALQVQMRSAGRWVWLIMAAGFGFLAFDELMGFHERIGHLIGQNLSSGVFRNWNDIVVILYGVAAAPIGLAILPTIIKWRLVPEMFVLAVCAYGVHTVVDAATEPSTVLSVTIEESAKLYCGAFFALGTFSGVVGIASFLNQDSDIQ